MNYSLGVYYSIDSLWHRRDPRVKLFLVLILGVDLTCIGPSGLLWLGFLTILLYLTAALPNRLLLEAVAQFKWLLVVTFLVNWLVAYFNNPFRALDTSLGWAGLITLRLGLLFLVAAWLGYVTKPVLLLEGVARLLKPLAKLGLPMDRLLLLIDLSLRFFPELLQAWQEILLAQKLRGLKTGFSLRRAGLWMRCTIIPVLILCFRNAVTVAVAMEARGYRPGQARTALNELNWNLTDLLVFLGAVGLFCLSWIKWS